MGRKIPIRLSGTAVATLRTCKMPLLLVLAGIILMSAARWIGAPTGGTTGGVAGGALASAAGGAQSGSSASAPGSASQMEVAADYRAVQEYHQAQLCAFLEHVEGVGNVSVLVRLDGDVLRELAVNSTEETSDIREQDASGGSRETHTEKRSDTVITVQGADGASHPVQIRETVPAIASVCVVCSGGGRSTVQERIVLALSTLYDIPPHKVVVITGR